MNDFDVVVDFFFRNSGGVSFYFQCVVAFVAKCCLSDEARWVFVLNEGVHWMGGKFCFLSDLRGV